VPYRSGPATAPKHVGEKGGCIKLTGRISSLRDRVSAHPRHSGPDVLTLIFFRVDAKRISPLWTDALSNLTGAQRERIPCTRQL